MIAVVQRVKFARVRVAGETVGEIGTGLLVLLGIAQGDTPVRAVEMANKLANLRCFEDEAGKMNRSALELGHGILLVSQFTLLGDTRRGRRPSFEAAARPEQAEPLYEACREALAALGLSVATGRFRTEMEVELLNDGPVTLILELPGRIDAS